MAGWDAYRDNLLAGKNCSEAAIVGVDGNVWTTSPGLATLNVTQAKALITGFTNGTGLQSGGILLGNTKFMYLQSDKDQIQGKKGSESGVSIALCKQCLVIGIYGDGMQAGNCRKAVEAIADYLKNSGY